MLMLPKEKKNNHIKRIAIDQNKVYDKLEDIEEAFRCYFKKHFTTTSPSNEDIKCSTKAIPQRVTDEMKIQLNKEYTRDEIEVPLK